ncbi:hypothetical protein HMPREF0262_02990 [Clostridium sp. ATCC 29733]|nr:hypothetical protein HMPREF0262_02990 [Clostridium sp. ATCC 29733]
MRPRRGRAATLSRAFLPSLPARPRGNAGRETGKRGAFYPPFSRRQGRRGGERAAPAPWGRRKGWRRPSAAPCTGALGGTKNAIFLQLP